MVYIEGAYLYDDHFEHWNQGFVSSNLLQLVNLLVLTQMLMHIETYHTLQTFIGAQTSTDAMVYIEGAYFYDH